MKRMRTEVTEPQAKKKDQGKKSNISNRRIPSVCLMCIENLKPYSLVDDFPSSIDRHVKRNHFNDSKYCAKNNIRPKDHEDAKELLSIFADQMASQKTSKKILISKPKLSKPLTPVIIGFSFPSYQP